MLSEAIVSGQIGKLSEFIVSEALRELAEERRIMEYRHGSYAEDRDGKDFIITLHSGEEFPLQVKSSHTRAADFAIKKNGSIPIIVVHNGAMKVTHKRRRKMVARAKEQIRRTILHTVHARASPA